MIFARAVLAITVFALVIPGVYLGWRILKYDDNSFFVNFVLMEGLVFVNSLSFIGNEVKKRTDSEIMTMKKDVVVWAVISAITSLMIVIMFG